MLAVPELGLQELYIGKTLTSAAAPLPQALRPTPSLSTCLSQQRLP